ncbi:uncharacterized protein GGS25DRAFT_519008 [Hypoxylon fragiforme]|uniref:uncharacterized protein n=1 Tax=Hypoxylon fragiforme TaxID=63214 RepID=UPI0020C655B1|nr:uncharacterized protein GGS25DRAFT_519008 [Hypoxylon fragiforme]KAI2610712.1 hypothetical protein GGS25DRAFT_519008 [Hypoxylon fragiforme]
MKLNFFTLLLPFQASIEPTPHLDHSHAHALAPPSDLQADIAGLIAMSRALWLEASHVTKETSEVAGQDIINDIVIEFNTLIVHNHTASSSAPVGDSRSSRSLLVGIGHWGHQTQAFLGALARSAQSFKDVGLDGAIAGNLTTLKTCSADFSHSFGALLPGLKDSFGKVVDELQTAFDDAIDALKE